MSDIGVKPSEIVSGGYESSLLKTWANLKLINVTSLMLCFPTRQLVMVAELVCRLCVVDIQVLKEHSLPSFVMYSLDLSQESMSHPQADSFPICPKFGYLQNRGHGILF